MIRKGFIALAGLGLTLSLAQGASAQQGQWVQFHNNSGLPMVGFEYSSFGRDNWGPVVFSQIVEHLSDVEIYFDDGTGNCNYNFRATFMTGVVEYDENVNVCEVTNFTYR